MSGAIQMRRVWAMPNAETFSVEPIHNFVWKYLSESKVSIDPFARNRRWATYTNDLNPKTDAECHMKAKDFLELMVEWNVKADLIIFDPPYSTQQIKEVYSGVGLPISNSLAFNSTIGHWSEEKELCGQLLAENGVFLHFGWHTNGLGKKRSMVIEEVLLVAHGRVHNDTICMAERRVQQGLFSDAPPAATATDDSNGLDAARKA
jgi:hypothetical protein